MAGVKKPEKKTAGSMNYSRRDFLVGGGSALAALTPAAAAVPTTSPAPAKADYPVSEGYLVYDSRKCAGCTTCMLACSLTHEGVQSLSLSRIQIMQDSFGRFPYDVKMAPCRQCVMPVCVDKCPVGAALVDTENGNIRRIDSEKCIGCRTCLKMCPQQPHRPTWNHLKKKSMKCDLCLDTPYWKEKGGVDGKQACVESCPMKAIKLATKTPNQKETEGYDVNLRNVHWINLGLVDSGTVEPPAVAGSPKLFFNAPKPKPETKE